MEILSRGGLKLMKDGHIQNIKTILFTYIYIYNPSNLRLEIQFSKSHNLKLAGYHCDCPLGGKVVQPHLYLYHESSKCSPLPPRWPPPLAWPAASRSVRCCGVQLPCQSRCQHLPHCWTLRWKIPGKLNRNWIFSIWDFTDFFVKVSMIILNSKFVNSKKMLLRLFADL